MARAAPLRDGKHALPVLESFAMDGAARHTEIEGRRSLPIAAEATRTPPRSVRLSLTDRCDLACVYCRPSRKDGYLDDRLTDDAWKAVVRTLVAAGVRRVRITGGEPLLHPRVASLVAFVADLGVDDLALTTNATRLAELAGPLRAAGLRRLTVSLDSLRADRFCRITRGGNLEQVLRGLDAALEVGFDEVKTNTVVLRGENDDELPAIVRWAWAHGVLPRFIELMRIGAGAALSPDSLVAMSEMRSRLASILADDVGTRDPERGPARYVASRDVPGLRVGFITGTTDTYCEGCDRLRVSSDGVFRPCLATNEGVRAAELATSGDGPGLSRALEEAWALKPDGQTWKGCTESSAGAVSIRAIGG
jgi:cyclic pyranopterin phosphate synthase